MNVVVVVVVQAHGATELNVHCNSLIVHLTEVIDKVKKEILLKGSSQPVTPKASLSVQVETLIKATFGKCYLFHQSCALQLHFLDIIPLIYSIYSRTLLTRFNSLGNKKN